LNIPFQINKKICVLNNKKIIFWNKKTETNYAKYDVYLRTAIPLGTRQKYRVSVLHIIFVGFENHHSHTFDQLFVFLAGYYRIY